LIYAHPDILDLARNHKPPIEVTFIHYLVGKPYFNQQVSMKLRELIIGPKSHHRNWKTLWLTEHG
jgi:hypothetical protein